MHAQDNSHLHALIAEHEKRLRVLELQAAKYGTACPPHIVVEIDETKAEIQNLRYHLENEDIAPSQNRDRSDVTALLFPTSKPSCPYPGMVPFRVEDTRFFYGRRTEIRRILQYLRHNRFLFVIGPSGSGKSSLVFAGILPRLQESSYFPPGFWLVRVMRPGEDPLLTLSQVLNCDSLHPTQAVTNLLTSFPPAQRLLLVIDQFEELFTQSEHLKQSQFVTFLKELRAVDNCTVLVVMRADFYADLMNSELWPISSSQRVEITRLDDQALRQAIQEPARQVGVRLETGLLERLLADADDEPGVLPMIQETMVLLWEAMQENLLLLNAYEDLKGEERSGLAVAMAIRADATLSELSIEQQLIARRIFLRLIQFGQGRADTRRQQPIDSLRAMDTDPILFKQTLRRLTDHRLLTLSGSDRSAESHVDIAHEALIYSWPTLYEWLVESREAEQMRRRLEDKAAEWARLGRGSGGLLDETQLLETELWLASSDASVIGYSEMLLALVGSSRANQAHSTVTDSFYKMLAMIVDGLSKAQTAEDILETIMVAIFELSIRNAVLYLVDQETDELVVEKVMSESENPPMPGTRLPPGTGIVGRSIADKMPILIDDTQKVAEMNGSDMRSVICVPMVVREKSVGAIQVIDRAPNFFNEEYLAILKWLAASAAQAVQASTQIEQDRRKMIATATISGLAALSGRLAHNLKNHLSAIKALARYDLKNDDSLPIYTSNIIELSDLALAEIQRFMQPLSNGELENVDLNGLLSEIANETWERIKSLSKRTGVNNSVRVSCESNDQPIIVYANKEQLKYVFHNLIDNACQAIQEKDEQDGHIAIKTSTERIRNSDYAVVCVEDNGLNLRFRYGGGQRIFDPSFTTNPGGMLANDNLYWTRLTIEVTGGYITVSEQPGINNLFEIHIPLSETQAR